MTKDQIAEVFSDFDPSEYEQEARERWGEAEAFKESARRTARYTTDDWKAIKRQGDEIEVGLAEALHAGLEPDAPEVQRLVRSHWSMINDRFYDCPPKMYRGLGEMYASDPRFA
ncbi:MAG: TipAS antibiotic-recognition domain-containing protein, partial [Coriobacteriia bacterium]|nr:TipAS antibiotic-recognition domain-containing protein [Coriobacteriia bacterium]